MDYWGLALIGIKRGLITYKDLDYITDYELYQLIYADDLISAEIAKEVGDNDYA